MSEVARDAAGRHRSPATMPGFHAGRPPRNKGVRYPADPPTIEEIVAVMRAAGDNTQRRRLRALDEWAWEQLEPLEGPPARAASRAAPVRHQRPDSWPGVVPGRRPHELAADGKRRPRSAQVRPAPASPRARGRDGS
jgi:hypothetical protein